MLLKNVNDEILWEWRNPKDYAPFTVNMECENRIEIADSIDVMLQNGAECFYLNKRIDSDIITKYLNFLRN